MKVFDTYGTATNICLCFDLSYIPAGSELASDEMKGLWYRLDDSSCLIRLIGAKCRWSNFNLICEMLSYVLILVYYIYFNFWYFPENGAGEMYRAKGVKLSVQTFAIVVLMRMNSELTWTDLIFVLFLPNSEFNQFPRFCKISNSNFEKLKFFQLQNFLMCGHIICRLVCENS